VNDAVRKYATIAAVGLTYVKADGEMISRRPAARVDILNHGCKLFSGGVGFEISFKLILRNIIGQAWNVGFNPCKSNKINKMRALLMPSFTLEKTSTRTPTISSDTF